MTDQILQLTASELRELYTARKLSPVEVVAATLKQVEEFNPRLNALVTVTAELATAQAVAAESVFAAGIAPEDKPLLGIPITVKDNISTEGIRTTGGSLLAKDAVPLESSPAPERALRAGAIMLGKTNTPEFGWKAETTNRVFGTTRNPWNLDRTPGGSAGGAAACVATGIGPIAIGTDGAGSVRIPASFTGIFGFKPTFGLIPAAPNNSLESLGHIGILSRSVDDAATLLTTLAGVDPRDRLSLNGPARDWRAETNREAPPLRIAWSRDLGYASVGDEIAEIAREAAFSFRDHGATVEEVDVPFSDPHDTLYSFFAAANAGMHRDNWSQVRELVDPGRIEMIEEGFRLTAGDIGAALVERAKWTGQMVDFMQDYDLLLTPTLPTTAFEAGLDNPPSTAGTDTSRFRWTPYTYGMNLTGQPAASVPCGLAKDGLPVGLHLIGRRHEDDTVLRAAKLFEGSRPWASLRAPMIQS